MDHLPLIADARERRPIPYYGANLADSSDDTDMSSESGSAHFLYSLHKGRWDDASPETLSGYVQNWLYFGLLGTISTVYGTPFDKHDFLDSIDGVAVLTTQRLAWYIAAWMTAEHSQHRFCQSPATPGSNLSSIPATALKIGLHVNRLRGRGISWRIFPIITEMVDLFGVMRELDSEKYARSVTDAVYDSVLVLVSTTISVLHEMVRCQGLDVRAGFEQYLRATRPRQVDAIFDKNQWCPFERSLVQDLVNRDPVMLFAAAHVDCAVDKLRHAQCSAQLCLAYNMDEATYKSRHASDCSSPGCLMLGSDELHRDPAFAHLAESPAQKVPRLPVVTYHDGKLTFRTVSLAASNLTLMPSFLSGGAPIFVAISHVWADGLGNVSANRLPECQIRMIQNEVNKLFPEKQRPVPFWIDTLCLPLQKPWRSIVIGLMAQIYRAASKILVLDNSLRNLENPVNLQPDHLGLRILCAPWSRRLWTLQEAGQLQRTCFLFGKDLQMSYPELRFAARNTITLANVLNQIPPGHPLRQTLIDTKDPNLRDKPRQAPQGVWEVWRRDRFVDGALNPAWSQLESWFDTLPITTGSVTIKDRVTVMRGVMHRTLSKLSDEAIVCASMFGKGAVSAGDIANTAPDERYRVLFTKLEHIPRQIIYLNQARYEEYGTRWIPRSLLRQNSPVGFQIQYRGESQKVFSESVTADGLYAKPKAFMLQIEEEQAGSFPASYPFILKIENAEWLAHVHDAGSSEPCRKAFDGKLAILYDRDTEPMSKAMVGALVTVLEYNASSWNASDTQGLVRASVSAASYLTSRTPNRCRFEALVDLTVVEENETRYEHLTHVAATSDVPSAESEELFAWPWRVG